MPRRRTSLSPCLRHTIALVLLFTAIAAVGCRSMERDSAERLVMGHSVAIRPNELTNTVAVLTYGEDDDTEVRVDVYRIVSGRLPVVWPVNDTNFLQSDQLAMIRSCEVRRISSWKPGFRRIDGLWPVGPDGSVLSHEYRLGIIEREEQAGWEGASLVMRDGNGARLWELSPHDIFSSQEAADFEAYPHIYEWLVGVAFIPDMDSVCVFAKGGHFRTIGLRDGRVGKNIVDKYSYAR